MNPNATLDQLRNQIAFLRDDVNNGDEGLRTVVELFEALDEWLSAGGCKPDAWHPTYSF